MWDKERNVQLPRKMTIHETVCKGLLKHVACATGAPRFELEYTAGSEHGDDKTTGVRHCYPDWE